MQGFPPHFPGSIVMRGWAVEAMAEVYLGTVWRVVPPDPAKQRSPQLRHPTSRMTS